MLTFAEDSNSGAAEPVPLRHTGKSNKEPPTRIKIMRPAEDRADPVQRILRVPPKLSFKQLILETSLWQHTMSSNLKSPPEGLKPSECKKGKSMAWPPIPYVPPSDLIKKRETTQIKVKMPNDTNFGMVAFVYETNEDYLSRPNISTGEINYFYKYIILYQINILLVQYGKCLCT